MKIYRLIAILFFVQPLDGFAQLKSDSVNTQKSKADTSTLRRPVSDGSKLKRQSTVITVKPNVGSRQKLKTDSTLKLNPDSNNAYKINADTAVKQAMDDSSSVQQLKSGTDSSRLPAGSGDSTYQSVLNKLLSGNKFVRIKETPVFLVIKKRHGNNKEYLFYLASSIILVFGFFKVFYGRYFNNIFRVFFNTSLRQNQLTDLLLQAKLPSLIFNIFFTIAGGLYIWLLIPHFYPVTEDYNIDILFVCVLGIGVIYIARFCVLKFIGWITGMAPALNTYIFVVFLVNKIIGITLIPLVLILAFGSPVFFKSTLILTLLALALFSLIRFFRSYSLLQQQLNISMLQFLFCIISLEVLPLLVIYKFALKLLLKL